MDTNVLVYAFDVDTVRHRDAKVLVGRLAQGPRSWALPWPCVLEFLHTVTASHYPRTVSPPAACEFLDLLFRSPFIRRLMPTDDTVQVLRDVLAESGVRGSSVHDAHIFALCLEHGVRELYTADKGFRRFRGLKVTDPFAR